MADRKLQLPNLVVNGHAFGRNVNHDPKSLRYKVGRTAAPKTVEHEIRAPILDQGQIGKCVAETGAEWLTWSEAWETIPEDLQRVLSSVDTAEEWTSALYHELTSTDDFPGTWQPDDTGSDGLTLGKVLQRMGLISGFQHVTTVGEAEATIQDSPFAIGTVWLENMENPRPDGTVQVSGRSLGGHEYLCFARDAERDLWWMRNHWRVDWGKNGTFAYDTPGLKTLMAMQGDITVPILSTRPRPEPAPEPTSDVNQPDWARIEPFLDRPRSWTKATDAAEELVRWRSSL